MKRIVIFLFFCLFDMVVVAQDYGSLKKIDKQLLIQDLELLRQGLEKHHSGMYWYTPKDSVDSAFERAKNQLDRDLNELEFFNLVAPLVGLSREDHTNMELSEETEQFLNEVATYLPLKVVFLDKRMYITQVATGNFPNLVGSEIVSMNGKSPIELVEMLGELFASDGYIKAVKYSDLSGFSFSEHYFLKFGFVEGYNLKVKTQDGSMQDVYIKPKTRKEIAKALKKRVRPSKKEFLEFTKLNDSTAYLGVHTFASSLYRENTIHKNYKRFLSNAFKTIAEVGITNLIIDVSKNGGGNEGNENLLYSYVANNYQKYTSVCAKSQRSILDNGIDPPKKLKTFGFFERVFNNKKMSDGSYCRKRNAGFGLMAYKKEPEYKYKHKLYVMISPITYSGGSEFANMIKTQNRAIFVGEETGGGYRGNTSGYSSELTLPHSQLLIDIPSLKFEMNVNGGKLGRGVIPDYKVIPSIQEYLEGRNIPLEFILEGKANKS